MQISSHARLNGPFSILRFEFCKFYNLPYLTLLFLRASDFVNLEHTGNREPLRNLRLRDPAHLANTVPNERFVIFFDSALFIKF